MTNFITKILVKEIIIPIFGGFILFFVFSVSKEENREKGIVFMKVVGIVSTIVFGRSISVQAAAHYNIPTSQKNKIIIQGKNVLPRNAKIRGGWGWTISVEEANRSLKKYEARRLYGIEKSALESWEFFQKWSNVEMERALALKTLVKHARSGEIKNLGIPLQNAERIARESLDEAIKLKITAFTKLRDYIEARKMRLECQKEADYDAEEDVKWMESLFRTDRQKTVVDTDKKKAVYLSPIVSPPKPKETVWSKIGKLLWPFS